MNLILYVHDYDNVFWPKGSDPTEAAATAQREINDLVGAYTMGKVSVDALPEDKALGDRVEELETIISGNIDQWWEAKSLVLDLVNRLRFTPRPLDTSKVIRQLILAFDLEEDLSD